MFPSVMWKFLTISCKFLQDTCSLTFETCMKDIWMKKRGRFGNFKWCFMVSLGLGLTAYTSGPLWWYGGSEVGISKFVGNWKLPGPPSWDADFKEIFTLKIIQELPEILPCLVIPEKAAPSILLTLSLKRYAIGIWWCIFNLSLVTYKGHSSPMGPPPSRWNHWPNVVNNCYVPCSVLHSWEPFFVQALSVAGTSVIYCVWLSGLLDFLWPAKFGGQYGWKNAKWKFVGINTSIA